MKKISILVLGLLFCFLTYTAKAEIFNQNEEHYKNPSKEEIKYFNKLKTCSPYRAIDEAGVKMSILGRTKGKMCRYYENHPSKTVNCTFPMSVVVGLSTTILDGIEYNQEGNTQLFSERFAQFSEIIPIANDYCTVTKK